MGQVSSAHHTAVHQPLLVLKALTEAEVPYDTLLLLLFLADAL